MKRTSLILITGILPALALAQTGLDSLIKVTSRQTGKEKVLNLCEICFQYAQVETNKAISYGAAALKESKKTGDSLLMAQAMNDFSIAYLVKGNYDSVIVLNEMAYGIRIRRNERALAAASLAKMASAYYEMGQLDKGLALNFDILKLYETLHDEQKAAQVSNNIGTLYEKNRNLYEAEHWYRKAIEISKRSNNYNVYIQSQGNLALVMAKQKKLVESENLLLELVTIVQKHGSDDQLSIVYQGLGTNYRERKEHAKGLEYYEKALELCKKVNNEMGIANLTTNIGEAFTDLKDFGKAEQYLQESLKLSTRIKSMSQLEHVYKSLAALERKKGNSAQALTYLESYSMYHDSIYNTRSNELLAEMNARYQAQQKETALLMSQNQLAESQLALSRRNMWISLISAIVVALSGLVFILRTRHQAKQNQLKQEAKLQLDKERLRISRDLHDNIGAELTWISAELDTKAYTLENSALKNDFTAMGEKTRSAIKSLRETIWAIHNENISPQQILSRITEQTKQILQNQGITLATSTSGTEAILGPNHTLHIYRICKEAINNSIKHAKCSAIEIDSRHHANTLTLKIKDNGKGLNAGAIDKGYGLNNIEQRTKEMGGYCRIDSDMTGTCVTIEVPLSGKLV